MQCPLCPAIDIKIGSNKIMPQMSDSLLPRDYTYCKGQDCDRCEQCWRYVQGKKLPEGNWWWMMRCEDYKEMIEITK